MRLKIESAPNELGFLQRFAAVVYALNWSIVSGNVDTTDKNRVEDVFYLKPPKNLLKKDGADALEDISNIIDSVLAEHKSPREIFDDYNFSKKDRRKPIKADIDIVDLREKKCTVIFVETKDRSGLLYGITEVLCNNHIDIRKASIRTISNKGRAEDVFYTLTENGDFYGNTALAVKVRDEIERAI